MSDTITDDYCAGCGGVLTVCRECARPYMTRCPDCGKPFCGDYCRDHHGELGVCPDAPEEANDD